MTVIDIFKKHESRIWKPTKIITQFDRCYKCNINGTDTVGNELQFMHVISWELHRRCNIVNLETIADVFKIVKQHEQNKLSWATNKLQFNCLNPLTSLRKFLDFFVAYKLEWFFIAWFNSELHDVNKISYSLLCRTF